MNNIRLSKSAVNSYLHCPYLFKLGYIDKVEFKETPRAMSRGSDIHELFDKFFKHDTITTAMTVLSRTEEGQQFYNSLESAAKLAQFINGNNDNMPKPLLQETKLYDEELNFVGIVDAVFSDGDDILVLDYKTGRKKTLKNYYFELSLYTLLVEKKLKQQVKYWGIYFIDSQALVYEQVNRKEINKSLQIINDVRKKVDENRFEKKPSRMCKYCIAYINGVCNGKN